MKQIWSKIDTWLLEHIFQPVIDLSQKQPHWWAEQVAYAYITSIALRLLISVSNGTAGVVVWTASAAGALLFSVLLLASKFPAVLAHMGVERVWRFVWVALFVWGLPLISGFETIVRSLTDLTLVFFYYFAACRPPKPPKKRESFKHAFGEGQG